MNQDTLNFLKWQILSRLPNGSIYERVKNGMKNLDLANNDPFYYIYWKDLNRSNFKKYVLGTFHTQNADYISFIQWLDCNYQKGNFYQIQTKFGTIMIPRPKLEDYKCFKAEFLDIVMPYLIHSTQPYLEGPYEYQDVQLEKGDTVFDLGANYGLFSSVALAHDCQVYAFEPTTEVKQQYLDRLARQNENLEVLEYAVSNQTGISAFEIHSESSCNQLSGTRDYGNTTSVKTITLDDFVQQEKLSQVDFIKADIEGAERLMLEGAKETLKEFAPKLSICYYHKLDDLKVLSNLIKEINPNYEIQAKYRKIYVKDKRK